MRTGVRRRGERKPEEGEEHSVKGGLTSNTHFLLHRDSSFSRGTAEEKLQTLNPKEAAPLADSSL